MTGRPESPPKSRRIEVRTTITIPDFDGDGLKQVGTVYVSVDAVRAWLTRTADACDEAHGNKDIGAVLRGCVNVLKTAAVKE